VHELAWIWRLAPTAVWDCPVDVFHAWLADSDRVIEKFTPKG
jgi:hypothetical protein